MGWCPVDEPWSTFCWQRALLHVNITCLLALSSGRRCECWLRRLGFPGSFPLIALTHRFGPMWMSIQIMALDVTEIPRDFHFVSNLFTEQQVPHKRRLHKGSMGWTKVDVEKVSGQKSFAGLRFRGGNCAVYTFKLLESIPARGRLQNKKLSWLPCRQRTELIYQLRQGRIGSPRVDLSNHPPESSQWNTLKRSAGTFSLRSCSCLLSFTIVRA